MHGAKRVTLCMHISLYKILLVFLLKTVGDDSVWSWKSMHAWWILGCRFTESLSGPIALATLTLYGSTCHFNNTTNVCIMRSVFLLWIALAAWCHSAVSDQAVSKVPMTQAVCDAAAHVSDGKEITQVICCNRNHVHAHRIGRVRFKDCIKMMDTASRSENTHKGS